jgi:NADPH:quinone reductase-like Zn-dependent oxidoreductase
MKAYVIRKGSTSLDGLQRIERPEPKPGPREILIRVRATSLNYRDHLIINGHYVGGAVDHDVIPLCDGAGEVAAIGADVTRFKVGDRVASTFFQCWIDGPPDGHVPALGSPLDGMLAEYVALSEEGAIAIPANLSFDEAATLPCAALTAWNGLMVAGRHVQTGETVLCLGTGGVSIFSLQFARAAGARVIITSSSDEKLKRARALGAADGINYKTTPDWEKKVLELTSARGADHIVEVGGIGTLARSYEAVAYGGKIALIGVLAGLSGDANPIVMMLKGATMNGIYVGSRVMFEQMNRTIELHGIQPVIDKTFSFDQTPDAWRTLAAGDFFGKIVIRV